MISVAMAAYNGEKYIAEQLESICNQTQKADEIIVVDDCSLDNTAVIVQKYIHQYPECNIRFFSNEENLGYKKNFCKAMSLCSGDILFLCDQDDIWQENKIEVLTGILKKHKSVSLVSSSFIQIDGSGQIVSGNKSVYKKRIKQQELVPVPLEDLIFHNISQGCAMAFRKEVRDLYLQFFVEELPHDWILNIVAAIGKKCYYLNSPLFSYRIHGENTTGLNDGLTLNKKNSLAVRTHDAREAVKVLDLIEKMDSKFYHENGRLAQIKRFATNHVAYLEHKRMGKIILQNLSPYYRKLKTVRGRLLDMFYCVK